MKDQTMSLALKTVAGAFSKASESRVRNSVIVIGSRKPEVKVDLVSFAVISFPGAAILSVSTTDRLREVSLFLQI